jgi:hypothetical protein
MLFENKFVYQCEKVTFQVIDTIIIFLMHVMQLVVQLLLQSAMFYGFGFSKTLIRK